MKKQQTTNTEKLLAWLAERPAIAVRLIEQEAKIPSTTIAKAKEGREIPDKHWPALVNTLKKYGLDAKLIKINKEN